MSGIIREPLAGLRATCPVPPGTPVALSSPRRALEGIPRAAALGLRADASFADIVRAYLDDVKQPAVAEN